MQDTDKAKKTGNKRKENKNVKWNEKALVAAVENIIYARMKSGREDNGKHISSQAICYSLH